MPVIKFFRNKGNSDKSFKKYSARANNKNDSCLNLDNNPLACTPNNNGQHCHNNRRYCRPRHGGQSTDKKRKKKHKKN